MNQEEYLKDRLEDQISWYDKKSQTNQKWFKRLRLLEIVSAVLIPFLTGIRDLLPYYQIVIGALGVVIAISAGMSTLYKFQENWIQYRTTTETLKHEKFLFMTKCDPYVNEDAFSRLVQRVEALISKENTQWSTYVRKEKN